MSARRPWTYAFGGAVVAAAVLVGAVAVAGDRIGLGGGDEPGPGSAASSPTAEASPTQAPSDPPSEAATESPSGSATPSAAPSATPSSTPPEPMDQLVVAAYYLGPTPGAPRLFREFRRVATDDPLDGALRVLQGEPNDPDYRTPWPAGSFRSATFDGTGADGAVGIELGSDLTRRPATLSRQEARLAVQQVVHTVQAAVQARASVDFYLEGRRVPTVYGVRTPPGLRNAPALDVLSPMSITSPEEGATVSGRFTASGVGSSFEANVPWEIRRGGRAVKSGFTTAEGWMDKLYPWRTEPIDVSGLEPGRYVFVAMTDDPSGGEEGNGPTLDTRTIVVR